MLQRIERHAPHHPRRGIAAAVGHPCVGRFVQRNGQQPPRQRQQQEEKRPLGILKQLLDISEMHSIHPF